MPVSWGRISEEAAYGKRIAGYEQVAIIAAPDFPIAVPHGSQADVISALVRECPAPS